MSDTIQRRVTDILHGQPEFSKFDHLVRTSKVIAEIDTDEPFTIFAPTNDAFEKLPAGTIGEVMEQARLREVVSFHIVSGMVPRAELREQDSITMLTGQKALLECVGQTTHIGGALITMADMAAENGFVHAIDTVMFPD
jgi:uncharacterized surface protein with fasciclin (FAS1) repeats